MNVLEYSIPPSWRREMTRQDFYPTETGMKPFVDFCTRLEATELSPDKDKPTTSSRHYDENTGRSKRPRGSGSRKQEFYCELHGSNPTHDTPQCRARKHRRYASDYTADRRYASDFNAERRYVSDYSPDRRRARRSEPRLPKTSQELNAIIAHQVKKAFANKRQKKREINAFKKFREVKLSDSEASDAGENTSVKSDEKEVSFASDSENLDPSTPLLTRTANEM